MRDESVKIITTDMKVSWDLLRNRRFWNVDTLEEIRMDIAQKIAREIAENITIEAREYPDFVRFISRIEMKDMLKKIEK